MKTLIYFLIIVLWSINMEAKVKLPPLLSDNMVLQQKAMYESGEKRLQILLL